MEETWEFTVVIVMHSGPHTRVAHPDENRDLRQILATLQSSVDSRLRRDEQEEEGLVLTIKNLMQ